MPLSYSSLTGGCLHNPVTTDCKAKIRHVLPNVLNGLNHPCPRHSRLGGILTFQKSIYDYRSHMLEGHSLSLEIFIDTFCAAPYLNALFHPSYCADRHWHNSQTIPLLIFVFQNERCILIHWRSSLLVFTVATTSAAPVVGCQWQHGSRRQVKAYGLGSCFASAYLGSRLLPRLLVPFSLPPFSILRGLMFTPCCFSPAPGPLTSSSFWGSHYFFGPNLLSSSFSTSPFFSLLILIPDLNIIMSEQGLSDADEVTDRVSVLEELPSLLLSTHPSCCGEPFVARWRN
ncbi:hypothetical protein IWX49DRAFT_211476 [Phyllosticta citricarpa]|uniref:Uncharacterized protein n=2 Tax=Phyllosticta TaxID=121621 RepID=A0ABR1MLW0_9PEZI